MAPFFLSAHYLFSTLPANSASLLLIYAPTCSATYLFICVRSYWFVLARRTTGGCLKKQISLHFLDSADNLPPLFRHKCTLDLCLFCCVFFKHTLCFVFVPCKPAVCTPLRTPSCAETDSAHPINAFHWDKAPDAPCGECVHTANYLINMGNKQTIFTDEQLDAYQVGLHYFGYTCITWGHTLMFDLCLNTNTFLFMNTLWLCSN